jgi:hypothetical protein
MGGAPAGGAPPPDLGGSPTDLGGGGLSGTSSPTTKAEKIDSNDPWELLQAWVDQLGKEEKLLKQAKVDSVERLKGKPVEVTFDGNRLEEWRILTEVL